jgi:hypothetical protein
MGGGGDARGLEKARRPACRQGASGYHPRGKGRGRENYFTATPVAWELVTPMMVPASA